VTAGRTDDGHGGAPARDASGDAWDLPGPSFTRLVVAPADIDAYRHVNNAVYVTWLDRAAWEHSAALGLPVDACLAMDRGMAVLRSTLAYVRPALLGDAVTIATWLAPTDVRLRARRRFQVRRDADGATLLRAEVEYVCIELSSGRPVRAPAEFRTRYAPLPEVASAYAALAAL
jgi:acyl-CoA thioester hydrolase